MALLALVMVIVSAAENLMKAADGGFYGSRDHLMLVIVGAGDGLAIRCDESHQRQHHDSGVERPSIQTATQVCLPPERHLQRGPSSSCSSCACRKDEVQTAKSASPRCDVHLQRNFRMQPEHSAWQACAFRMEHLLAGNYVY